MEWPPRTASRAWPGDQLASVPAVCGFRWKAAADRRPLRDHVEAAELGEGGLPRPPSQLRLQHQAPPGRQPAFVPATTMRHFICIW